MNIDEAFTAAQAAGSFRDPSGQLFVSDGVLYRSVLVSYREEYDKLMGSGLYENLTAAGNLIPHEEVEDPVHRPLNAYKILRPERVPFISYPYEWSFSQLKDAGLLTLEIARKALDYGMTLKDASAYNVQFYKGRPVFIDTLSFETYREGSPWIAYRQFCQHFLAPLALMSRKDVRLSQLLRIYIDGVPLDLASALLPWKTRFSPGLLMHLHLHAATQKRFSGKDIKVDVKRKMSRQAFLGLLDHLQATLKNLKWKPAGTEWENYYSSTNYSEKSLEAKKEIVSRFLDRVRPKTVWDMGANTGLFSRIASGKGTMTLAFDIDPAAVEKNYLESRAKGETGLLPLVLDLSNPSGALGWAHEERASLAQRGPASMIMALALIHHLTISNHVPLERTASFFSGLAGHLIIEFVPREDSQVQKLLRNRTVSWAYDQEAFETAFQRWFRIEERVPVEGARRTLYLMAAKKTAH